MSSQPGWLDAERKVRTRGPRAGPGKGKEPRFLYQRMLREIRGSRYIDLEKDTQFSEAWVMLGLLLTLLGLVLDSHFLMVVAMSLFVVAAASWVWNQFSLFGLHYKRHLSQTRAFLGETIQLTLEIRNQKLLPLSWLEIVDICPSDLRVDGGEVVANPASHVGEFRTFWMPGAFQRLSRRFTIHCSQRGYHVYGPATVHTGDGFGFFSRKAIGPERDQIIVYPRLYSSADLRLPSKNPFGQHSVEARLFEDPLRTVGIREWQPSDSLRRVHWKATARHQQILSRIYEPSEDPQILIFLNVATLPRHWQGTIPELMERAISVAASLAAVSAELRLPFGMIANGVLPGSDQPVRLLPSRSHNQLVRILESLAGITSYVTMPIEELLLREAPRVPLGATFVVVTARVHDELLAALLDLQKARRELVLFTLAEEPPGRQLPGILVYHLPHLVDDLIGPEEVVA